MYRLRWSWNARRRRLWELAAATHRSTQGAWHAAGRVRTEREESAIRVTMIIWVLARLRERATQLGTPKFPVFAKINRPHLCICIYIKAFYFLSVF